MGCCLPVGFSQDQPVPLQYVFFNDKVLANKLYEFSIAAKTKAVKVDASKQVDGFLYHVSKIYFVDDIEDQPTRYWGQWKDRLVLFYSSSDLREVCTIMDTTVYRNVVSYSESILPQIKLNPRSAVPKAVTIEGLEWTFKVSKGYELFFYDNQGYDSRDMPQPLPEITKEKKSE